MSWSLNEVMASRSPRERDRIDAPETTSQRSCRLSRYGGR